MMGFRSVPFRLFFCPLPLVAVEAPVTCLALFIAAFLMSAPFIIESYETRDARSEGSGRQMVGDCDVGMRLERERGGGGDGL